MKITHLQRKYPQYYSFKSKSDTINNLTGIDVLDKYRDIFKNQEIENDKKNTKLQTILYNSIFQLFNNGYYKNAKILYDELRKNTDISNEIDLNKIIGDIYKKQDDLESAEIQYKAVYDKMDIDYSALHFDELQVIKNSAEADIISQKDTSSYKINEFGKSNSPYLNLYSLYFQSKKDLMHNNKRGSLNDIDMAYSLMESKKLYDNDIILGKALALSDNGNYVKSSEILNKNLKYLEDNQQTYSREFVENLLLLGINDYETQQIDNNKIINLFKNCAQIADEIELPELVEIADYMIAKILFLNNDKNFEEFAENFLDQTNNVICKINLNEMLGDYYISANKDKAIQYYNISKSLAMENEIDKAKIIELCQKIKKISPEQKQIIDKEIESLKSADLYDLNFLINILTKYYREEQIDLLQESCEQVLNNNNDEINKNIAKVYLNFANIKNGYDFERLIEENKTNLKNIAKDTKVINENLELNKFLFTSYTNIADILYKSQRYNDAANYKNEADKYIFAYTNKNVISKHKIQTTLMNYKAKNYYEAEKAGLEYLEILLGDKLPQQPAKVTEKTDNIIQNKKDSEKRKIASVYETLGLINLKNRNIKDSEQYFWAAVNIRERLFDRDLQLANSYSALARLAIINKNLFKGGISSKDMHNKAIEILNNKYPNDPITKEEKNFHEEYYGCGKTSIGKFAKSLFGYKKQLIEKFKCYNKELNICE